MEVLELYLPTALLETRSIYSGPEKEDFFSLLIPLNEICHVALSYLRMYACNPGTLWGEHPSEQVGSIVQHLGRNI